MKRLFAIVSLLMLSFSAMAEQKSEGVVFDKQMFDFGNVMRENKNYTCAFVVENKSDKPLV